MILVTGGAGYIGTHAVVELLSSGFDVLVLDNFSNSSTQSLKRVELITGKKVSLIEGDIRDSKLLNKIFSDYDIVSVVHFAGLKAVGESVSKPLSYYDNNVHGSQVLFQAMADAGVFTLVFSSSATVYGDVEEIPYRESMRVGRPTNPYARSKLMVEDILRDLALSDPRWRIAILRYFNPIGAHESGLIGEDPNGIPNNLMPFITRVAIGRLSELSVFGGDYLTHDGTGVRDYIHVVDLAKGHVVALSNVSNHCGVYTWNLGAGKGYSVLDVVHAFERVNGISIPYKIVSRRSGDIAEFYADTSKALAELGWAANLSLERMVEDSWRWQRNNPNGYSVE